MFRQLPEAEAQKMIDNEETGLFCDLGFVGRRDKFIVDGRKGFFLADEKEMLSDGGFLVGLSDALKKASGGVASAMDDAAEEIAKEHGVSVECALAIMYLRTRSRHTQDKEDWLIYLGQHNRQLPNMNEDFTPGVQLRLVKG